MLVDDQKPFNFISERRTIPMAIRKLSGFQRCYRGASHGGWYAVDILDLSDGAKAYLSLGERAMGARHMGSGPTAYGIWEDGRWGDDR
jgi:hypothetical protein